MPKHQFVRSAAASAMGVPLFWPLAMAAPDTPRERLHARP